MFTLTKGFTNLFRKLTYHPITYYDFTKPHAKTTLIQ